MEQPIEQPQTTLREVLETNVEAAEQGTLPERMRDEAGRFAPKPLEPKVETPEPQAQTPAQWAGPSTWKKEYRPLYDKLASGQPLTPDEAKKIASYTNERENDFKTGVSTYKAEAMQAKDMQEAITPYLPELQSAGINPSHWIRSMAQAHYALYKGTPELKLQVFQALARQFNVPVGALFQQNPQPTTELMGYIQQLQKQVQGVTQWRQQQETQTLSGAIKNIAEDKVKYPHYEAVRETMAQLLETGLAQDLQTAYDKAVWMVPEAREQLSQPKPNVAAQARARAISPKSGTPVGQVAKTPAKGLRSAIEDAFDSHADGRV